METKYKAYPPDLQEDKAIGILLPFNRNTYTRSALEDYNRPSSRDVGPFQLSYTTEEQAISNLINLLLTRIGERVMHPTFGTIIRDFLFEPNDSANRFLLESDVQNAIEYWLPYIYLRSVEVLLADGGDFIRSDLEHSVVIRIQFSVTEQGANRTISIFGEGDNLVANIE